ncbi:flagellar hook-associated protein FlgK [Parachitinimonas caeni]|uniref:Flagellar hook-associated protein 1 n=1 Tax=Parachitinimonas caeni TaxID=3031301 RepID=A0ABT7DUJ4_9NEIS|nr:flagellar hook-associated protein FlgK [Parachitinimonas caeni]MDK2123727.1 flagellar hook-associated protein FlgK [Parachitinimonas caeni]
MGNSIYGIAVSGLSAAQIGLTVTGHNIANASTPGYSRQVIRQSASSPQPTGGGFVGRGAQIDTIKRNFSEFTTRQVQGAQAQASYLEGYLNHIKDLDNLLADPSAGLTPALQDFFRGVQTAANNPASVPARQSLLGLSESLIARFQTLSGRVNQIVADVNLEITSTVSNINAITSQIADLNDDIVIAAGTAGGQPPNDLLDKRDQLVKELNQYIKSSVVKQSDGSYNIFVGNGQNLVVGNQAFTLGAVPAKDDPQRIDVAYQQYGIVAEISSKMLTGGTLGGILEFRESVLDLSRNSLGRVALALAQTFNDQHRQGQDLNGIGGTNFFKFPLADVQDQHIGSGDGRVSADIADNTVVNSAYTLAFDGTNYNLTRTSDGLALTLSQQQMTDGVTAMGIRLRLNPGTWTAGDTVNLSYVGFTADIIDQSRFIDSDFSLAYDGTNYTLTRLSDGRTTTFDQTQFSAGAASFGIRITPDAATTWTAGDVRRISFPPAASKIAANRENRGNADMAVAITNVGALTTSDYEFSFEGPDYRVTRKSDNTIFNISASDFAKGPVTVDGLQFRQVAGTLLPGDRFLIQPTKQFAENLSIAIKDPSLVAAATPIRANSSNLSIQVSANPANTGGGTITGITQWIEAKTGVNANPVEVIFTNPADHFDVKDTVTGATLQSNVAFTAPQTLTVNGYSVTLDGGPNPGDRFRITPRANTGNASVTSGTVTGAPVNQNLKQPVSIIFNNPPTSFNVTGLGTNNPINVPYVSGSDISFNGWSIKISGQPGAGDVFTVGPNTAGVADNRNMLKLGELQTKNILAGGTTTYQGSYSKLVSDVGVKANEVNINYSAQTELLKQAETSQQGVSGVNLDEEAANLLIYQQAYLAASRTVQIAQKAFEEVLNIGR